MIALIVGVLGSLIFGYVAMEIGNEPFSEIGLAIVAVVGSFGFGIILDDFLSEDIDGGH